MNLRDEFLKARTRRRHQHQACAEDRRQLHSHSESAAPSPEGLSVRRQYQNIGQIRNQSPNCWGQMSETHGQAVGLTGCTRFIDAYCVSSRGFVWLVRLVEIAWKTDGSWETWFVEPLT